ncbi:hypothetical protein ACET3Z_032106 [Daucus carota]
MRREKENFKNSNFKLSNNHANGDRNLQEGQWFRVMRHQVSGKRIVVPKKDIEVSVQDRVDNRTYAQLTLYVARDFYGQPEHSFKKEVTRTDAKNRQRNRPQRKEALPTQVQSLGEQRVDGISENLVKQPSFRTIQGNISNGCQQLLNRSLVGSTKGSVQPENGALVPDDAPDPINFNVVVGIAGQVNGLSLGQEHVPGDAHAENGVPEAVPAEQMMANGGVPAANPGTANGGVHIQANIPPFVFDEPIGDHEETFQPGAAAGFLFAGDPPLEDID